jgi:hypothetical protein
MKQWEVVIERFGCPGTHEQRLINKYEMPAEGLEPTRPCGHWILSPARLPIPPRRRENPEGTKSKANLKRFQLQAFHPENRVKPAEQCTRVTKAVLTKCDPMVADHEVFLRFHKEGPLPAE